VTSKALEKLAEKSNERAARHYRDRVADREIDAAERKTEQIVFSGQPPREQDSNQRRGDVVPEEVVNVNTCNTPEKKSASRTAWPARALEESDRDSRPGREDELV